MSSRFLSWLPLVAAIAAPAPLLAQDWTPTGDRILSDPTYLPLEGQVSGDSSYSYGSTGANTFVGGAQTASSRETSNALSQSFAFGVTNELSVSVGDTYEWVHDFVSPTAGTDYARNDNGFTDPTFGLTYRLLDQRTQPLDVDLSASYAPNFIGARGATTFDNGAVARGGDALDLKLAVARETRFMTVQGYVGATRYGQATSFNDVGDSSVTSSYWQPVVGIATQTRFNDRLSLNVGGQYDFSGDYNVFASDDFGRANYFAQVDRANLGDVSAALNYHFIRNRLVGSVVYAHTFYGPEDVSYIATPNDNYGVQRSGDSIGAQLRYVFR